MSRRHRLVFGVALLLSATELLARRPFDPRPIGDRVVEFARDHLNQTVGNGECAALAARALRAAGAALRAGPDFPGPGDYVWGRLVYVVEGSPTGVRETGRLADVHPGDIMQYRSTRWGEAGGFAHHTAIVGAVEPIAGRILIYQQNIGGRRYVLEGHPRLDRLRAGWIRFYRPLPAR
jgi:myosin tail region-interacting protein MTI1